MSLVGRWQFWYDKHVGDDPFAFDPAERVFQIGADWLADCVTVADWGCGGGLLANYLDGPDYIGVDGSKTPAVDVVADLDTYREISDGIFMRHVLEHNYRWEQVLDNALDAFHHRFVLVLFTPWHTGPEDFCELRYEAEFDVPTLAFRQDVIEAKLDAFEWDLVEVPSPSAYGVERIFLVER